MKYTSFWQWNILWGLGAALLFGVAAPLYKGLVETVPPLMLSGLSYTIAGTFFLGVFLLFARTQAGEPSNNSFSKNERLILAAVILFGGVLAPLSLLAGLALLPAHQASILLNAEVVITILIAILLFKEGLSFMGWMGAVAVVMGTVFLNLRSDGPLFSPELLAGEGLILLACLFWALDNNLTQLISQKNIFLLSGLKAFAGGMISLAIALILGIAKLPTLQEFPLIAAVGLFSIGFSLLFFILSLRYVGTAKTAALFATAPLFGFLSSMLLLQESPTLWSWFALVLMTLGVLLIAMDEHEHEHEHDLSTFHGEMVHALPDGKIRHSHRHTHGGNHRHSHWRKP